MEDWCGSLGVLASADFTTGWCCLVLYFGDGNAALWEDQDDSATWSSIVDIADSINNNNRAIDT